jgi:hypothetical protein
VPFQHGGTLFEDHTHPWGLILPADLDPALYARITTAEADINALESDVAAVESDVAAVELSIELLQSAINAPATAFPVGPTEGELFYETDTDKLWVWDGTNWVELGRTGAWTSFTPTLTQPGAITKTNTYSRWTRFGRTILASFSLAVTAAGTAGSPVQVGLPFSCAVGGQTAGSGWIYDASTTTRYAGSWEASGTTVVALVTDVTGGNVWGAVPSLALASGDVMEGILLFEAAASV